MPFPTRLRPPAPRGSTLLVAVIIVSVLAAIGGAAVLLSSRDRINAGAKTRRDVVSACAAAAQAKLWADFAKYGTSVFDATRTVPELTLADGTKLGTLHYDQAAGIPMSSVEVLLTNEFGDEDVVDLTNRATGLLQNKRVFGLVARCTVPGGPFSPDRQVEVELRLRVRM